MTRIYKAEYQKRRQKKNRQAPWGYAETSLEYSTKYWLVHVCEELFEPKNHMKGLEIRITAYHTVLRIVPVPKS